MGVAGVADIDVVVGDVGAVTVNVVVVFDCGVAVVICCCRGVVVVDI